MHNLYTLRTTCDMLTDMRNQETYRIGFTNARKDLSKVYSKVASGGVVAVERHNARPVVMVDEEEFLAGIATAFPITTQASFHDGQVSLWVEELPVHAVGSSFEEAAEELVDAALDFAGLWQTDLRLIPNHAHLAPQVRQIQLAHTRDQLRKLLIEG